jgi:hypothetical protein
VSVLDVLPEGTSDPEILEWAAREQRVVLTNDTNTMIGYAKKRIENGQPMPGLIVLPPHHSLGPTIEQVRLIAEVCSPDELRGRIVFLPLKKGDLSAPAKADGI